MDNKITLVKENGEKTEAELFRVFNDPDSNKKYAIYTYNEVDNDLLKLYISEVIEIDGKQSFKIVETDAEWNKIKEYMREVISGGNQ